MLSEQTSDWNYSLLVLNCVFLCFFPSLFLPLTHSPSLSLSLSLSLSISLPLCRELCGNCSIVLAYKLDGHYIFDIVSWMDSELGG